MKVISNFPAFSVGAKERKRCFCVKKEKLSERSEFFSAEPVWILLMSVLWNVFEHVFQIS